MKPLSLSFALLALATSPAFAAEPAPVPTADPMPAHCPVSGEELGSMGKPYIHVHQQEGRPGREVPLCCKMCLPRFEADPDKYLRQMDAPKAPAPAERNDTPPSAASSSHS